VYEVSRTVVINDDPDAPQLDREQVWQGLLLKANDALPFVPQMDSCHVLDRGEGWLIRDVQLRGVPLRERVTFEPGHRVVFERIRGVELGRIENVLDTDEQGRLTLRFSFALSHEDLPDGSPEEQAHFEPMRPAYSNAVAATLAAVRRTLSELGPDALAAAATAPARPDVPDWIVNYYRAVDSVDLAAVMALHTDDTTVTFANNPTAVGKEQMAAALSGLFAVLRGMRHTFVRTWETDGGAVGVVDARVTYLLVNGAAVTVPTASLLTRRDGLISDLRINIDMTPVFAALQAEVPEPAGAH
jgi:ketosteroid isomerase-like protein